MSGKKLFMETVEKLKTINPELYALLGALTIPGLDTVDRTAQGLGAMHEKLKESRQESHELRQELIAAKDALELAQAREQASVAAALEQAAQLCEKGCPTGGACHRADANDIRALIPTDAATALSRREAAVRLEEAIWCRNIAIGCENMGRVDAAKFLEERVAALTLALE